MKYLRSNAFLVLMIVVAFLLGGVTSTILLSAKVTGTIGEIGIGEVITFDVNESSWNIVKVGMSESEVKSIMGEPISVYQWPNEEKKTLNYRKSGSNDSDYVQYHIVIQDGKVVDKKKEVLGD